jgi:hypothetical protein
MYELSKLSEKTPIAATYTSADDLRSESAEKLGVIATGVGAVIGLSAGAAAGFDSDYFVDGQYIVDAPHAHAIAAGTLGGAATGSYIGGIVAYRDKISKILK